MKIDLVGPKQRGLAMGLNEASDYTAVSLSALLTDYLAQTYGLRLAPFVPSIAFALMGLLLSAFFVRETHGHARLKAQDQTTPPSGHSMAQPSFGQILLLTSWKDRA